MTKLLSKLILLVLVAESFLLLSSKTSAAGTATLSLSPSSGSYQVNNTFDVTVMVNSGSETINAAQAKLTYDAAKLEYVGVSKPNSNFPDGPYSGGSGVVTVAGYGPGTFTGDQFFAKVTFKVLVGSGTTTIGISTTDSYVIRVPDFVDILGSTSGGTYTLTAPPVVTPPTTNPPATTPPSSTTKTPSTSTSAPTVTTTDITAPKISGVSVTDVSYKAATIVWTTNEDATSNVEFGPTEIYGSSVGTEGFTTAHKVVLPTSLIIPGTLFQFKITSVDKAGNKANSTGTFKTKGYTITIKVIDENGIPLSGVKVILTTGNNSAVTDSHGVATLYDVYGAKQEVKFEFAGKVYKTVTLEVKADDTLLMSGKAGTQNFEVKVAGIAQQRQTFRNIGWAMILLGFVALISVGVVWLKNRKKITPI